MADVTILIGNSEAIVVTDNQYILDVVKQSCTYQVAGAKYTPQFQKGLWSGTKSVFNKRTKRFPAGMLFKVATALTYYKISYEVVDKRKPPTYKNPLPTLITLHEYQKDAVEKAVKIGRGIIESPTGSGKTIIAIELASRIGANFIILTNRKDMIQQLKEEAEKWTGRECGVIWGDIKELRQITVATIQTLSTKKGILEEINEYFEGIIIDEYHHAAGKSYLDALIKLNKCFYRFGFTATPYRNDDAGIVLASTTGRPIFSISKKELEDKGFLVPAQIKMIDIAGKVEGEGYSEIYDLGIVYNNERNDIVIRETNRLISEGQRVLVLVTRIAHGRLLSERTGWKFIEGSTKKADRLEAKEDMKLGDLNVLIATGIFDEGIDIPSMTAVVFAGAGKSKIGVVQRVGRALRPFKGKTHATIIDFMDKQSPMLEAQSFERLAIYGMNGWKTDIKLENFFR